MSGSDLYSDDRVTPEQAREIEAMEVTTDEGWRDGDDVVCLDANGRLMALDPSGEWHSETDETDD